jgi:hypothetical protein
MLAALTIGGEARAVIVITSDPTSTAPYTVTQIPISSAPAGSGAAYEGFWQVGAGTVVGPNEFLTATHLAGNVGDPFNYQGVNYQTTGSVDVGNGMTLWYVNGSPFSSYATVFGNSSTTNSVAGSTAADFGQGMGANIYDSSAQVHGPDGLQGYQTNIGGIGLSYGPGQIVGYYTDPSGNDQSGTNFLYGGFFPNSAYGTAFGTGYAAFTLAGGDSGGGLFAKKSDGTWVLVGVNYGVTDPYSSSITGSNSFYAAMWDQNGFYTFDQGTGTWVPLSGPQNWSADAITPLVAAGIAAAVPEPATLPLLSAGLALAALARRRRKSRADPSP